MPPSFGQSQDASTFSPAERWSHDRRIIASWLQRESGGHFDGAELRADGSSYVSFLSPIGQISVHDYWSFARLGFQPGDRAQSYAAILGKQEPVLTLGYTRPGETPLRAELVVFLNGEVVAEGYAGAFGPLTAGKTSGELIAIETTKTPPGMNLVNLYSDPFLVSVINAIREQSFKPPGI
jgi:hypothetical protein